MAKRAMILLLIALTIVAAARAEDFGERSNLKIQTEISIPVKIILSVPESRLSYLWINYSWIPKEDYRQKVLAIKTFPDSQLSESNAFFDIKYIKDFTMVVNFTTLTTSDYEPVKKKTPFPLKTLDDDAVQYTKATELIDITPEIKSLASELASNEDDLYVVVFKLADWVNTNINYSLTSTTSEASFQSSWVLRERRGVCDELSNLFISMLRSLGIPARFVSGISYTESELFARNWGGHGWVEVYFPEYGWVPFDPTYNQLGYVDATHIKLEQGREGSKYNTEYEWRGKNVEIEPGELSINTRVLEKGPKVPSDATLSVRFLKDEVAFGSYNVVTAEIKNREDRYLTESVSLANTKGIKIMSERIKDILLKPRESKQISWVIRVDENLEDGYIYTFPIEAYTQTGEEAKSEFNAKRSGDRISWEVAESYLDKIILDDGALTLECSERRQTVYENDDAIVDCTIRREIPFKNAEICLDGNYCKQVNFTKDTEEVTVSRPMKDTGFTTMLVEASSGIHKERTYATFNVIDPADIDIISMDYEEKIKYDEKTTIIFTIARKSESIPRNVTITLEHPHFLQEWKMDRLVDKQSFKFDIDGNFLKLSNNIIKIRVVYYDEASHIYTKQDAAKIELYNLTLMQRLHLIMNSLNAWLPGWER